MDLLEKLLDAKIYIQSQTKHRPKIGIILGSGLGAYGDSLENADYIDYANIPNMPMSTIVGHKGRFVISDKVICMQGRFHYYEGYHMEEVTFPIRVMKLLGVETLIVTNAAGGANIHFSAGELMIISDHINLMGVNPLIGKNIDELGERFPDMSSCYNRVLIQLAKAIADSLNISVKTGVYCAMTGPNYETPAEVKMIRILGGDAVGMSTVPEVIVANHCGLKVLGISCITNMAAGVSKTPLNHMEVMETSEAVKGKFISLISEIIKTI